jgi:hypothetical protein
MSVGHIIFILIGALVAAFGVRRYLPKTLLYFRPGGIYGTFYEGASLDPDPAERAAETVQALAALGFTPAGVLAEKPPLWSRALEVLVLTGREGKEIACVIPAKRHLTWYFETLFEGGQLVITAESGFKPTNEGGLYQSVPNVEDPAELLTRHRDNVAHFAEGQAPLRSYPPDIIGGTTQVYYGFPVVRRGMRTYGSMNAVPLAVLCIPLIIALAALF